MQLLPSDTMTTDQRTTMTVCWLSYPNFVWGLSFIDLLILASRLIVLNASYRIRWKIVQCFDQECKIPKKRGKRVFSLNFLDPSSPRLASGSPGSPKDFSLKEPAHLGDSYFRSKSSWSQVPFFLWIGVKGSWGKGYKGQNLRELREKKKKEEEMKPRHCRIATVINLYVVTHSVFFVCPSISFYFLGLNVIYVPLGVPLAVLCTIIFSIHHCRSLFLCKVQS